MDIEIDRLDLQVSGMDVPAELARAIGGLIGETLEELLRAHVPNLAAATGGYRVPSLALPVIRLSAGATDDEIARIVADAVTRSLLRELEV